MNTAELKIEVSVGGSTEVASDKQSGSGSSGAGEGYQTKFGENVQRIYVDQRLDSPDFFSVELRSLDTTKDVELLDALEPGAAIEIQVGYGELGAIAKGEVSYIEPHFSVGDNSVTISGYDYTHRLTRGTNSRTFGDGHKAQQDPGGILSTVVSESQAVKGGSSDGLAATPGSAESKLEYIAQYNMNDYQFIQQVVGNFGLGWDSKSHADGKNVSLKPIEKSSSVLKIHRDIYDEKSSADTSAISADFRLSTVRQIAKVEVRGWDAVAKKPLLGVAESLSMSIGGTEGFKQTGKAHYGSAGSGRVLSIVDIPVASQGEAQEIAQSILDKLSMDWMTADVVVEGNPKLHAGVFVELVDFGQRYSGEYLVEGCQHVIIPSSGQPYKSYLKLARNASPEKS